MGLFGPSAPETSGFDEQKLGQFLFKKMRIREMDVPKAVEHFETFVEGHLKRKMGEERFYDQFFMYANCRRPQGYLLDTAGIPDRWNCLQLTFKHVYGISKEADKDMRALWEVYYERWGPK